MRIAFLNANGVNQIAEALGKYHRLGRDHFTDSMLCAWANEAEAHFAAGNGCHVEISRFDSVSGHPVVVEITPDGYDVEDIAER
ncbi:hypothetical protein CJO90_05655 [Ralstonia solanacearum]|nr:hypothetical protein CJO83_05655 [Ralstonia solanacearum]AXW42586.1 hypothetical protein CJO90_05655 [Ralstonia solanacearum]AXW65899.1 hypothetical protein CJO95_05650 [Ralstonia solanacearum]